jgi:hypothetical protein
MKTRKKLFLGTILSLVLAAGSAAAAIIPAEDLPGQEKDAVAYKQAYALVLDENWTAAKTAMDQLVRQ